MDIGPIRWLSFSSTITEEFHAVENTLSTYLSNSVPDMAIYWTLGKFLKPLATINLPK